MPEIHTFHAHSVGQALEEAATLAHVARGFANDTLLVLFARVFHAFLK